MSFYSITSPAQVYSANGTQLRLNNTSTAEKWDIRTDNSENFIINKTDVSDVFTIDAAGVVILANGMRLQNGLNAVFLNASAATASYTYEFPDAPPNANQTVVYDGASFVWQDILAQVTNLIIVSDEPGAGQFLNIFDAVASIPNIGPDAPTDTNRYLILVYPGNYEEVGNILLPSYVYIAGLVMETVVVTALNPGYDLFSFSQNSGISFMTIRDIVTPNHALVFSDVGDYALIHKVDIENCDTSIFCESLTQDSYVYFEYSSITTGTGYAVNSESNGGFLQFTSAENFFTYGDFADHVIVTGSASEFFSNASFIEAENIGVGNGVTLNDGGSLSWRGVGMKGFAIAINAPVDLGVPNLILEGVSFTDCTLNLNILSTTATGQMVGYSEYLKTIIDPANSFFIAGTNRNIVTVAKKGADFTSVKDAVDAIVDATDVNQYVVQIGPGIYFEDSITMKPYVSIIGYTSELTIIEANDPATTLITGSIASTLENVYLRTAVTYPTVPIAGGRLIQYQGDGGGLGTGVEFQVKNIVLSDCETLVYIDSGNGECSASLEGVIINTTSNMVEGIVITDDAITHDQVSVLISGLIWNPENNPTDYVTAIMHISSSHNNYNLGVIITDSFIGEAVPTLATCLIVEGPVIARMTNSGVNAFATGISVPNTTILGPQLLIDATGFLSNTVDVNVANPATLGSILTVSQHENLTINDNANISVILSEPAGNIVLSGQILQGSKVSELTNITEQIQRGSNTGILEPPVFTTLGLDVTLDAADGYLMVGIAPNDRLVYVEWIQQTITLPADESSWLYVTDTGTFSSALSMPDYINNILIGKVKMGGAAVEFVQNIAVRADHTATNIDNFDRMAIGPIFTSGCLGSPGTIGMRISVSSGEYWYSYFQYLPIATIDIGMTGYYSDGGGGYTTVALTDAPLFWDDASGVLQALGAGDWVKHAIYVVNDGADQIYLFVYAQELFASQLDAEEGSLPTPPPFFEGNIAPIIGLVVNGADVTLTTDRFRDIRPTLQFRSNGSTASADHNSLLNLPVGDAHPQYFRTDGTRVMTGDVQVGDNDVTGVLSLEFVDGGSGNTITMAPPVLAASYNLTLPDNGGVLGQILSANGAGTTVWTNTAGLGTSLSTPNTLMARDANADTHVRRIYLDDGTGREFYMETPLLAADYGVIVPDNVGAIDQVLKTSDGLGTLNWYSVTNTNTIDTIVNRDGAGDFSANIITATLNGNATNVTGIVAVPNGGTGTNTLTLGNVLVGNGVAAVTTTKAAPSGDFVGTTDVQVLTNKTLTTPTIASINNGGLLTLPVGVDTLVSRNSTDTLTNKTITAASNNVAANSLKTTGASVNVSAAAPPVAGQYLVATAATTATWQTATVSSITNSSAESLAVFTTGSAVDVLVTGMSINPGPGTYFVWYEGATRNSSAGATVTVNIYNNGVLNANSERQYRLATSNSDINASCTAVVVYTVGDIQVGTRRNAGTTTITGRSLRILRVA